MQLFWIGKEHSQWCHFNAELYLFGAISALSSAVIQQIWKEYFFTPFSSTALSLLPCILCSQIREFAKTFCKQKNNFTCVHTLRGIRERWAVTHLVPCFLFRYKYTWSWNDEVAFYKHFLLSAGDLSVSPNMKDAVNHGYLLVHWLLLSVACASGQGGHHKSYRKLVIKAKNNTIFCNRKKTSKTSVKNICDIKGKNVNNPLSKKIMHM